MNINTPKLSMTGWKQSAEHAPLLIKNLECLRTEILQEYPIRDILVLGMGGSALGTRVLKDLYAQDLEQAQVRLRVVDTTEPRSIAAILQDFDVAAGLVFVSSKSGGTIEPLCLGQIFFKHAYGTLGSVEAAAGHFISISDEGTPLSKLAESQRWRGIINTPKNVGGRFSVLSAFGLAPLVLAGVDMSELIKAAYDIQCKCTAHDSETGNELPDRSDSKPEGAFDSDHNDNSEDEPCPAIHLADSLYQNMCEGRDKLIIGHDAGSESFARWLEQLIAESLGKNGKGLIPLPMPAHRANRLLSYGSTDIQSISFSRMTATDVGASLQRWMFAIEKIAQHLQLDPYDQPNVEAVKLATSRALHRSCGNGTATAGIGTEVGAGTAATATGAAAGKNSSGDTLSLHKHLSDPRMKGPEQLPELIKAHSFIVLSSWAPMTAENIEKLESFAADFEQRYQRPVVIAEGPHYLHASGQLYKGGPAGGIYLLLIQDTAEDLPIPGASYSLKQLYCAAASGDCEVMLSLGKPLLKL